MQTAINAAPAAQFPCLMTRAEAANTARLEAREVRPVHVEFAARAVLGNMDLFADFIGVECFGRKAVDSDYCTRRPGRLNDADLALVMHAALVAADRGDAAGCLEAMRLVTQRYLLDCDALLQRLAADYAAEA